MTGSEGQSLRDVYLAQCALVSVHKPNSQLVSILPNVATKNGSLEVLDLSLNVVGSKGLQTLLQVIQMATGLKELNVSGNNLGNPIVTTLAQILITHPSIRRIDLSHNPITTIVGKHLLKMLKRNINIIDLNVDGTIIRPLMTNCIGFQLTRNRQMAGAEGAVAAASRPAAAPPAASTSAPRSVHFGAGGSDKSVSESVVMNSSAFQFGTSASKMIDAPDDEVTIARQAFSSPTVDMSDDQEEEAKRRRKMGGGRRKTVSSAAYDEKAARTFKAEVHLKSKEQHQKLTHILQTNPAFKHLDDREMRVAVDALKKETFLEKQFIFKQGDDPDKGVYFYVLTEGKCEKLTDDGKVVQTLTPPSTFGEDEMMVVKPRDFSIKVVTPTVEVWSLERDTYRQLLTGTFLKKRELYYDFLGGVEFLKCLTHAERIQLADALEPHNCEDGDYLIRYGEEGKWFYIIVEGTVEVFGRDSDGKVIKVCDFTKGDCVGELEFINNHQTVADVRAKGHVRAVKLNRPHFELCMGPVMDILKRNASEMNPTYTYYNMTISGAEIHGNDDANPYAGFSVGAFSFGGADGSARGGEMSGSDDEGGLSPTRAAVLEAPVKPHTRRKTVSSEVIQEDKAEQYVHIVVPKTPDEIAQLERILKDTVLFGHLDDRELQVAIEAMARQTFKKAEKIINQGEQLDESYFYVLTEGQCRVTIDNVPKRVINPGEFFGELELMYIAPRIASVTALSDAVCWTLERAQYRHIMTGTFMRKRKLYEGFLKNVGLLKTMTHLELLQLADALQPEKFEVGEHLISFNEAGQKMHIIVEGTVEVIGRDSEGKKIHVCDFKEGDCVGELEFIYNHNTVADVVAKTHVRAAYLDRAHFELCMGPIVDVLKRNASEENTVYDYYNQTRKGTSIRADALGGFTFGGANESARKSTNVSFSEDDDDQNVNTDDDEDAESPDHDSQKRMQFMKATGLGRRHTVSSEVVDTKMVQEYQHKVTPKSKEDENWLRDVLHKIYLFKHLDDREINIAVEAMYEANYKAGEMVFVEGQTNGDQDTFHVIREGSCGELVKKDGKEDFKRKFKAGDYFGELELMCNQPRQMSVKAITDVKTWALTRNEYRLTLSGIFMQKRTLYSDFLRNVKFLSTLTQQELIQLADALEPYNVHAGEYLIRYGDEGTYFYLILEGVVQVFGRDDHDHPILVCDFKQGDCVGELEFIHNHKTVADVKAKTDVRTARLNRPHFEMCMGPVKDILARARAEDPVFDYYNMKRKQSQIIANDADDATKGFTFGAPPEEKDKSGSSSPQLLSSSVKINEGSSSMISFTSTKSNNQHETDFNWYVDKTDRRNRRKTVSSVAFDAEEVEKNWVPVVHEKPEEDRLKLMDLLKTNALFAHLEEIELKVAVDAMFQVGFVKGEYVMTQGDEPDETDSFYVVMDGECNKVVDDKVTQTLKAGECFGETEVMYQEVKKASFLVTSAVMETYALDQTTYQKMMSGTFIRKRRMYEAFLKKVGFLKCMTHLELLQLADALQPQALKDGEYLIEYDDEGKWMFLIVEGTVEVIGRVDGKPVKVCEFSSGDVVGELEFIYDHRTVADVKAKGPVRAAKLNRAHFEMCMGPVIDVLKRNASEENPVYDYYNKRAQANKSGAH